MFIVLAFLLATSIGDTRVADAAQQGNLAAVQSLIKQADVNVPQGDGNTALHWAAYRGDIEMTRVLIQARANVKPRTRLAGMTPLHLAASSGNAAIIDLLVKAGADPDAANDNGTTALMLAAASGKPEAVQTLLDRGANPNARDFTNGQTAVMFAAALDRGPAIALLAARGADLTVATKVSEVRPNGSDRQARPEDREKNVAKVGGNTALHFAAREGKMAAIRTLVAAGANVNQLSATDSMSPLVQAIITGHFDVAAFLLEHGADANLATKNAGVAPLWAVMDARYAPRAWYPSPSVEQEVTGHLDLMKRLLAHGARVDARLIAKPWFRTFGDSNQPDPAGSTAFYRAAMANDVPAMRLLLQAGANPTIPTTHRTSPILVAAGLQQDFQGANFVPEARLEAVRFLIEETGADANSRDDRGYSVLHAAAFLGRNDIIDYLVAHGADVAARANQVSNGPSTQAAKPGKGDTVADMANGWAEKTLQYPETVTLVMKLGSEFSNTCWASVCVNPTRLDKKPQ